LDHLRVAGNLDTLLDRRFHVSMVTPRINDNVFSTSHFNPSYPNFPEDKDCNFPEMLVTTYTTTRRHITEDNKPHLQGVKI
jgi:hypothetical protein